VPKGTIVKAISGYYYVRPDERPSDVVQCRARGVFKVKGVTPLVGDRVVFDTTASGEGTVLEVLPRTHELTRPPEANADTAVLVFSVAHPDLNLHLLDKMLVHVERAGMDAVLGFSKIDLVDEPPREEMAIYERIGYPVVATSVRTGEGIAELARCLSGRTAILAGQSGTGKSSLLNALVPGLNQATGEISDKLGRGRHTTRHVELVLLPGGGMVADAPGFSQLDVTQMEADQLADGFREFRALSAECRFRGCLHRSEPGCRVREAVQDGRVAAVRYEHYIQFLEDIMERKRRY